MSLTTNFNFTAFAGDLKSRPSAGTKNFVSLSLLSSEDMTRMAFVEVRTPCGSEDRSAPWVPVRNGFQVNPTFYDTRMGNFDVRSFPIQACTTCSATMPGSNGNERCQGHFGYVSMPRLYPNDPDRRSERLHVVNPQLAEETEQLLQAECFYCHHLRMPPFDVSRYCHALRLLDAGLSGAALHLLEVVPSSRDQGRQRTLMREARDEIITDEAMLAEYVEHLLTQGGGTALDPAKAAAAAGKCTVDLRNQLCRQAIRECREYSKECSHCGAHSPSITSKNGHLYFCFTQRNQDLNLQAGHITQAEVDQWEKLNRAQNRRRTYLQTATAREHIKQLCQLECAILALLFPNMGQSVVPMPFECPLQPNLLYKVFFLDKILVPPLAMRLAAGAKVENGIISPDSKTKALSDVIGFVREIEKYNVLKQGPAGVTAAQEDAHEHNLRNLQSQVTTVYTDILESFAKKEGLFRMNMMGKRVNQACRSVISPDYLLEPNQLLLPRPFARSLTYPEQFSTNLPHRAALLKRCVVNGPKIYPGATHLEVRSPSGEVRFVELRAGSDGTRRQLAEELFRRAEAGAVSLIVHRHIVDEDWVVFNRQPTLHKVSMMGYRVKVLSGFKTLRFHYINGKSYNADFDGDEMNVHVPQSIEAQTELACLMNADANYLVPTSGKPIRGLIQDHIVAGVRLTLRDTFLDRDSFTQLVYNGIGPYMRLHGDSLSGHATLTTLIPIPAVLKPHARWTGKQLISVIVRYVTGVVSGRGVESTSEGVTLPGTSLIQPSAYAHTDGTGELRHVSRLAADDDRVRFHKSELLSGVICKNQLGPSNLSVAHVIHELFGPHMVGALFGAFGRVLTMSLQREGFSMGMDDMLLKQEDRRRQLLRELDDAPLKLPDDEAQVMPVIMGLATQLQKEFVPGRMLVPFPDNQLLMMTMSGAKGSNTNTIQMALGLGQQLFDGRRVKRMNSGKTLPAFFKDEKRSRSFGYAMGRFATGIRPAEYTIHAMAGRDGLIDTAVKTSRSGHLQRCLIKGLESLVIHWDHSVRDSNGSIVQFTYGGDGLDPMKASTLHAWEMAKDNLTELQRRFGSAGAAAGSAGEGAQDDADGAAAGSKRPRESHDDALRAMQQAQLEAELERDPLPAKVGSSLESYLKSKATFPLFRKVGQVARWAKDRPTLAAKLEEKRQQFVDYYQGEVGDMTARRRLRSYCEAGECVGLLAAQAAGEPSTQMTLNTFHSAGSTVTHVTEGIPRLRELLIYASVKKKAVIVPVERAKEADERAIAQLLLAGATSRLAECLACPPPTPGSVARGYRFVVHRSEADCRVTLTLLFSTALLREKQQAMCMSPAEHLKSFKDALRSFAKTVAATLRREHAASTSSAAGLVRRATEDPRGDADGDAMGGDDLDDEDDEDAAGREDRSDDEASATSSPGLRPRSDDDADSAAADDDEGREADGARSSSDDDEDDGAPSRATGSHRSTPAWKALGVTATMAVEDEEAAASPADSHAGYDALWEMQHSLGGNSQKSGSGSLHIAPVPRSRRPANLPDDLFMVNITITLQQPDVIAVVPDVVDAALAEQTFPSWLPQFDSVSFTRKADKPDCGELVFQGDNATMRQVTVLLSLFTVRGTGAITVAKARSTDIRDMCTAMGIESGYKSLLDELDKLFRRYAVDYHHLTLIADAATHRGTWENYNFTGVISRSASPLFQMTFASSKRFLHTAVTRGLGDELKSFSSAIMVGERPRVGTACANIEMDNSILRGVFERADTRR